MIGSDFEDTLMEDLKDDELALHFIIESYRMSLEDNDGLNFLCRSIEKVIVARLRRSLEQENDLGGRNRELPAALSEN